MPSFSGGNGDNRSDDQADDEHRQSQGDPQLVVGRTEFSPGLGIDPGKTDAPAEGKEELRRQ